VNRDEEVVTLLRDIRDGQQAALAQHREHLALARAEAERMRAVAEESLRVQRAAVDRARNVMLLGVPLVVVLLALLVYLLVRYRIL
jgi:hypothetical protein